MLTKDLLRYRIEGGQIRPAFVDPDSPRYRHTASELFKVCRNSVGKTRDELETAMERCAAGRTDYRIVRGLGKILMKFVEFEPRTQDAVKIRSAVFERAANAWPVVLHKRSPPEHDRQSILSEVAGCSVLTPDQLERGLYSDLPGRQRLIGFTAVCDPGALIARYNMELARGLLCWAERLTIDIEDSYQDVFRYIKLCRLMHSIERHARGYRIDLNGPHSLLKGSLRYGIKMAIFLPALALCRKWRMEATLIKRGRQLVFTLDDQSNLVSHFRRFPFYDSRLERDFAADFRKTFERVHDGWQLARADAVIPLIRNEVMVPDFTLRIETANGRREVHLEIVGFWTPEYLSRKLAKLRQTDPGNMIIAVSKQLALNDEVAEELNVLWFDRKLKAADVVEQANSLIV
jgi:predicted nuclease of restriction endonuclease-like RecB superfamily